MSDNGSQGDAATQEFDTTVGVLQGTCYVTFPVSTCPPVTCGCLSQRYCWIPHLLKSRQTFARDTAKAFR